MRRNRSAPGECCIKGRVPVIFFVFFAMTVSLCAQSEDFFKKLHTEKKLTLGLISDEPLYPFYFSKDNRWQGSDLDLVTELSGILNVTVDINTDFRDHKELLLALNEGRIDFAIGHLKQDVKEGLSICYSKPYVYLEYALLTNRLRLAQLKIPGLEMEELKNKKISIGSLAVPRYQQLIASNFPQAAILLCADRKELLNGLLSGKYDAVFGDEAELGEYFRNKAELGIRVQYWQLTGLHDELVIYVSWKNRKFLDWINIFLEPRIKYYNSPGSMLGLVMK